MIYSSIPSKEPPIWDDAILKRRILLDISLFTDTYLDEYALGEHASEVVLEVPAALATMIQLARKDPERSLLAELLYGYLQAHARATVPAADEAQSNAAPKIDASQTHEALRKRARDLARTVVNVYAPLIQGLEETATAARSESLPSGPAQTAGITARPIGQYTAFNPVAEQVKGALQRAYEEELSLAAEPLFDQYFLQIYHSERFGVAASPAVPRWVVSIGTSTFEIICRAFSYSVRVSRRQAIQLSHDLEPITQPVVAFLNWFADTYPRRQWKEAVLTGALDLAVGLIPVSVSPLAPILITSSGDLRIATAHQTNWTPADTKLWVIAGIGACVLFLLFWSALVARSRNDTPVVRSLNIQYEYARGAIATSTKDPFGLVSKPSTPIPVSTATPAAALVLERIERRYIPVPPARAEPQSGLPTAEAMTSFEMIPVVPIPVVVRVDPLTSAVPAAAFGADSWASGGPSGLPYVEYSSYGDICHYVAQPGDTVQSIASRFGVPAESIRGTQGQTVGDLRLHQMLLVPASCCRPIGGQGSTYIVQAGDRLYRLAMSYGISVQSIVMANGLHNASYIQAGQMLCMPRW